MLLVLGLAGLLGMPSVVFGEATWYGSFRGGLESSGDSTHMKSFFSRWGVKGSNEVSEGLSANYRYEEALDLATASLSTGNRLSYVGLSGGFGTISLGRIWSASWNSVGAILDNAYVYGDSKTSYRVGPAVSYSNSVGAASVQLDLVMDGANSAKSGVDQYEFGLSMDLGAATLAFAHRKKYMAAVTNTTTTFVPGTGSTPATIVVKEGSPGTPPKVTVTQEGTANTPTMVRVIDAVEAVEAEAAVTADNSELRMRFLNPNMALPQVDSGGTAITEEDCTGTYQVWADGTDHSYVGGDAGDVGTEGCYDTRHGAMLAPNPFQSAKDGTGADADDVDPVDETEAEPNIHRSQADCVAVTAGNLYEPQTGMCYPAGTTFMYRYREAKDAVEEVKASPIMVEVDNGVAGTPTIISVVDGTAGTAPTIEVTKGTAGTPSMFVTTYTTTPAYDQTLNAFAVKVAAGSHSAAVGLVKTSTSTDVETSTTIANAGGPLSDGLSYHLQLRDEEGSNNPWLIGLAKSLGGGSSLIFEHAKDAADEAHTALYLQVDF